MTRTFEIHLLHNGAGDVRIVHDSISIVVYMAPDFPWESVLAVARPLLSPDELVQLQRLFEDPHYPRQYVQQGDALQIRPGVSGGGEPSLHLNLECTQHFEWRGLQPLAQCW